MRRIISTLGSMRITVTLLIILLVVLASGTIVESLHDHEAANAVYGAWWFFALLVVFAINLVASLIDRWPRSWMRVGFVVTHGAMLIILAGALTTLFFKDEGRLALWEGQSASSLENQSKIHSGEKIDLGFTLRLDHFEIDNYPGTHRPAMFRSRVTTIDPKSGEEVGHVIEMNRELSWGGYKFFQSSYQMQGGRKMSVLSVSRDPGQNIVFAGYGILVLGMLIVLVTRLRQRRALPADGFPECGPMVSGRGAAILGLLLALGLAPAVPARAASVDTATIDALRTLPVQFDGRVMPLDTVARQSVWKVTGSRRWFGADPVATLLGWTFNPAAWADSPLVKIGSSSLAEALGLPGKKYISFNNAVSSSALRSLSDEGRLRSSQDQPLSPIQKAALDLEGRLTALHGFLTGRDLRVQPVSDNPVDPWMPAADVNDPGALAELGHRLAADPPPNYPTAEKMRREVAYNSARPTRLSWWILLPATVLAFLGWRGSANRWRDRITSVLLIAGFTVMTVGIAMRWQAAGRIPASNMYESLLFLAWGVGLFAALATLFFKNRLVIFNAAALSTLTILLVDLLPIDPFIHPMAPVLSGTPWLAIHVPIIMVSYALLGLSAVVAHMRVGLEIFKPSDRAAATVMDEVHYWYVQVGSILLIIGIMTGSIWAASSWGRYWGWDPKEVWSLVAFLAYMAILHARFDRWMGGLGVAAASILAFGTILMTYLGVNYVLAAGLHSYGFGGSKIGLSLAVAGLVEIGFVTAGVFAHRRNAARRPPDSGPSRPTGITIGAAT